MYSSFEDLYNAFVGKNKSTNVFNEVICLEPGKFFITKNNNSDTFGIVHYYDDDKFNEEAIKTGAFSEYYGQYQVFTSRTENPNEQQLCKSIIREFANKNGNFMRVYDNCFSGLYSVYTTRPFTELEAYKVATQINRVLGFDKVK